MSTADPQIEDFLSRVKKIDVDRIREDNLRRKKLEEEIAAKKKKLATEGVVKKSPLVPAKSAHLAKLNLSNSTNKGNEIQLINLKAREESQPEQLAPAKPLQSRTETAKHKHVPIVTLKDTLSLPKRTDLKFKPSLATPPSSASSFIPLPNTGSTVSDSASASQMMRPASERPIENTKTGYIPMPKSIAALSASAAAKAPQLMRLVDKRTVEKTETTSNYIPIPRPVAAMSASAAARAPQLMRPVDNVGEKEPGLDRIGRYLTQPGENPSPKPVTPKKTEPPVRTPGEDVSEAQRATLGLKSPAPMHRNDQQKPEALMKMEVLHQTSPSRKVSDTKPEALMKLGKLKPAIPAKKPELKIPDAVMRANQLRKSDVTKSTPKLSDFERTKEDLLRNSLAGLRKSITTTTREARPPLPDRTPTFPRTMPQMVRLPFMDPNSAPPVLQTTQAQNQLMDKNPTPQKLTHTTKNRAKGPKRRLPTSITSTPETSGTVTPEPPSAPVRIVVKPKKVPPPIRSSSRKVSTSEVFI